MKSLSFKVKATSAVAKRTLIVIALLAMPATPAFTQVDFIDTHIHMNSTPNIPCSYTNAINQALATMDGFGIQKSLVMPTPNHQQNACADHGGLAEVAGDSSGRFAFLGGGASLNPMILDGAATEDEITQTANAILNSGGIGFGEIAAEHFSRRGEDQRYQSVPPDHDLLKLLADIAANNHVPIDWHMEAVPCVEVSDGVCGIPLPPELNGPPRNPSFLTENLTAFERLLPTTATRASSGPMPDGTIRAIGPWT